MSKLRKTKTIIFLFRFLFTYENKLMAEVRWSAVCGCRGVTTYILTPDASRKILIPESCPLTSTHAPQHALPSLTRTHIYHLHKNTQNGAYV